MKDQPLIQCGTCHFWDASAGSAFGVCWRYPPQLVPSVASERLSLFMAKVGRDQKEGDALSVIDSTCFVYPTTFRENVCGEWKQAVVEPVKTPEVAAEPRKLDGGLKKKGAS